MAAKKQLGQILLDAGLIDEFQLKSALGYQKQWGGRLGKVLVENRFVTEEALVDAIHEQIGVPKVNLAAVQVEDPLLKVVPVELCEKHNLIPIGMEGETGKPTETIVLAMADPTDLGAQDEVRFRTGKKLKIVLASEGSIQRAIRRYFHGENVPINEQGPLRTDPSKIQFGGQDLSAEEMVLVQGTLETLPGKDQAESGEGVDDLFLDDDPFAELDSLAKDDKPLAAPAPADPVPPPVATPAPSSPGPPQPVQIAPEESADAAGTATVEEDLPEVEIVEEFEPEVSSPPAAPAPAAPAPAAPAPAAPVARSLQPEPPFNPPPPPAVELEGFAMDEEVEVDLDAEPDEMAEPSPVETPSPAPKPPPIREVTDSAEQPEEKSETPDVTETKQPAVEPQAPGPTDSTEMPLPPVAAEDDAAEQDHASSSAMDALLSRVGIKSSASGARASKPVTRDASRQAPGPKREPAQSPGVAPPPLREVTGPVADPEPKHGDKTLEEALVDEVQRLLDGIEARELSGEPPQVAKANNLIAALIRILLKKDVFTDEELLDELKRR